MLCGYFNMVECQANEEVALSIEISLVYSQVPTRDLQPQLKSSPRFNEVMVLFDELQEMDGNNLPTA
jgi:hypothetical protein